MKWLRTLVLFDEGGVMASADWAAIHASYVRAIASIDHPAGSGKLTLRRAKKDLLSKQWNRNGVVYVKDQFLARMVDVEGWRAEVTFSAEAERVLPNLVLYPSLEAHQEKITSDFGDFDVMTKAEGGTRVAIEWETGNVSSSHRSMNKLAIAIRAGTIDVGVLVVPSRNFYANLTDRIGNIGELSGYLAMWQALGADLTKGLLAITVVEHDELTDDESIPYLKVGKDGRAKQGAAKRL